MKVRFMLGFLVALILGGAAMAQDDQKIEVTGDYSYFRFNLGLSKYFNSHSLNGDGQVAYYITPNIGFAGDLQGYGSYTQCTKPTAPIAGCASGNLFTYMFGPRASSSLLARCCWVARIRIFTRTHAAKSVASALRSHPATMLLPSRLAAALTSR
jgi:hypothetical protein